MKAADEKHPDPKQIERFVRGEASEAENRALVRHFLHGCSQCQKLARKNLTEGSLEIGAGTRLPRFIPGTGMGRWRGLDTKRQA